jgi:hypothetical protein
VLDQPRSDEAMVPAGAETAPHRGGDRVGGDAARNRAILLPHAFMDTPALPDRDSRCKRSPHRCPATLSAGLRRGL